LLLLFLNGMPWNYNNLRTFSFSSPKNLLNFQDQTTHKDKLQDDDDNDNDDDDVDDDDDEASWQ